MPAEQALLKALGSSGGQVIAGLASQGFNAFNQGVQNRANRRHAEKMFQWEVDANRENWRRANEYNSPQQQMQRLKEAGLNPNLIYGNGATAMGGQISSSSAKSPQGEAPRIDLQSALGTFLDAEVKQVQIDNAKEVGKNLQTERLLKEAQIRSTNQNVIDKTWDLSRRQGLAPYQLTALQKSIDNQIAQINNTNTRTQVLNLQMPQIQAQTKSIIDENARRAQLQPYNIKKIVADTGVAIQNRLKLEYYNKNISQFEKQQLQENIKLIQKRMEEIDYNNDYKRLLSELQGLINEGQDPRMISEMTKGLFQRIFKF